jgi:hypothetical protein
MIPPPFTQGGAGGGYASGNAPLFIDVPTPSPSLRAGRGILRHSSRISS